MHRATTTRIHVLCLTLSVSALAFLFPIKTEASTANYLDYLFRIRFPAALLYNLPARDLNGIYLNSPYLEGHYITGISLDNVKVSKNKTASLFLFGTSFTNFGKMEGAQFTATVDDGSELTVRIDSVLKPKKAPKDVVLYVASYYADDTWKPLCGTDESGMPVAAVPLLGRWDYSEGTATGGSRIEDSRAFTFACDDFVLEKCVEAGYKPWASVWVCTDAHTCGWVSLLSYHQACTRMLRADYCGDGTSYTQENMEVALYDGLGIRIDTEEWNFEAEWDEDGALCADTSRISTLVPTCEESLVDDTCGDKSHFADGVLIMSELP